MEDFCQCIHDCGTDDCKIGCYDNNDSVYVLQVKAQCEYEYNYCMDQNLGNCDLLQYECFLSYINCG